MKLRKVKAPPIQTVPGGGGGSATPTKQIEPSPGLGHLVVNGEYVFIIEHLYLARSLIWWKAHSRDPLPSFSAPSATVQMLAPDGSVVCTMTNQALSWLPTNNQPVIMEGSVKIGSH